jgi:pimeloyl-ACP methyl ester carboxylesterase
MTILFRSLFSSAALISLVTASASADTAKSGVRNIVLVHGAWVDGAGWEPLYKLLKKDGYNVSIVQNATTSLADDVATTKRVLAQQDGPTILVGHSYGGAVITDAGNDPKVVGLVYIAAFAPDNGESAQTAIKDPQPDWPIPPILPPVDGFLLLDKAKFHASFAGNVNDDRAAFLANAQVPFGVGAAGGVVKEAAWHKKPSYYMVTTEDKMIPPPAQLIMAKRAKATTVEIKGSHAIYEYKPAEVAALIEKAARAAH